MLPGLSYLKSASREAKLFISFGLFFFFAFQSLSYFSLWTETEVYPSHSSQYLGTLFSHEFLFALKPLFYSLLKLSFELSERLSILPMSGARFLFALNGLAVLSLLYAYVEKKTDKYNAILAVLLLASANIFLERGFRVRSDLLSSALSLVSLLLTLNIKSKKDHWRFYIFIPLLFAVLLVSPKGVYWLLFSSCLIADNLKNKTSPSWLIVKIMFAVYLVFYFLSFVFKDPFFIKTIYHSAKFYLLNIDQIYSFMLEHSWKRSLSDFSHIALFAEKNKLLLFIITAKIIFMLYSITVTRKRPWDLSDVYFFVLLAVLLFHPQQKFFFLASLMPFFLIAFFTDWQWKQLINYSYSLTFKKLLLTGVFLYSLSYISYFNYRVLKEKNNISQKQFIKELNRFYKATDPLISIFDPACIVYSRKTNCKFIFYDKDFRQQWPSYLKDHNFDLILSSQATPVFELLFYKDFSFQYINVSNHIYYKALIFDFFHRESDAEKIKKEDGFSKKTRGEGEKAHKIKKQNSDTDKKGLKTQGSYLIKAERQKGLGDHSSRLIRDPKKFMVIAPSKNQKFLSGKKLMESLLSSLKTKAPERSRIYSYLFVNSLNQPVKKTISCPKEKSLILKPACPYSEGEFKRGIISLEKEKLALFYLPLPLSLPKELSLRILLRYDLY